MKKTGLGYGEIDDRFGISPERVRQIARGNLHREKPPGLC